MILGEQKYKNRNRVYYHGFQKDFDENKKLFDEFYLTTSKLYAAVYAKRDGFIKAYRLKDEANIFNMQCKTDEAAFRKFCQLNSPQYLKHIDSLKYDDWSSPELGGDDNKYKIKMIIRNLGYDGFFNKEINEIGIKELHKYNVYSYDLSKSSPAIAIFNKNAVLEIDLLKIEDIIDRENEENIIKDSFVSAKDKYKNKFDENVFINNAMQHTLVLSRDDIKNIIQQMSQRELEDRQHKLKAYVNLLMERLGYDKR